LNNTKTFESFTNVEIIKEALIQKGCTRVFYKPLAANDNRKQQIYSGPDFKVLNFIPQLEVKPKQQGKKGPIFYAEVDFSWIDATGFVFPAPNAKFIWYPQYPEVRLSGFLQGCKKAPSHLMNEEDRMEGRVLFLGIRNDGHVIAHVTLPDLGIIRQLNETIGIKPVGVFNEIPLIESYDIRRNKEILIDNLREIHKKGWIDSKRLNNLGEILPCNSSNCGGMTLEAEFGITPNGLPLPDYLGWELKQHSVSSNAITLFTPEPDGGFYKTNGVEEFIRKFGYLDKMGREDRLNFGGSYKCGIPARNKGIVLNLRGFDSNRKIITDVNGGLELTSGEDVIASWAFSKLINHWITKHDKVAYIKSEMKQKPRRQYHYQSPVKLCEVTSFERILKAFSDRMVYYDPGIKLEKASTKHPTTKRRSQFRIKPKNLENLYEKHEYIDLK